MSVSIGAAVSAPDVLRRSSRIIAARPGRDQATDDDVFLQALQRVDLAVDRGLGEHAGGLLEGGRRDEGRVCSDALVMPSSTGTGSRLLAFLDQAARWLVELDAVDLSPLRNGVAGSVISTFCSIWRTITSMCLSLIKHALQAVDLLDLVDEVGRQSLDALDRKNVVRRGLPSMM
jgi:hypothetical protein